MLAAAAWGEQVASEERLRKESHLLAAVKQQGEQVLTKSSTGTSIAIPYRLAVVGSEACVFQHTLV